MDGYKVGFKKDGEWGYMYVETRETLLGFIGFLLDQGHDAISVKPTTKFTLESDKESK